MAFTVQYARVFGGAAVAAASVAARQQQARCDTYSNNVSKSLHRGSNDYAAASSNSADTIASKKDGIMARSALFKTPSASHKDTKLYKAYVGRFGASHRGAVPLTFVDMKDLLADVGLHNDYLASRIFHVMDSGNKGTVSFKELQSTCKVMATGSPKERAEIVFNACDIDGSGSIKRTDLTKLVKDLLVANSEADPKFQMVKTQREGELYAGLDRATIAHITANKIVGDVFAGIDAKSAEISQKAFWDWAKTGGRSQNEFMGLFPLFEVFTE